MGFKGDSKSPLKTHIGIKRRRTGLEDLWPNPNFDEIGRFLTLAGEPEITISGTRIAVSEVRNRTSWMRFRVAQI